MTWNNEATDIVPLFSKFWTVLNFKVLTSTVWHSAPRVQRPASRVQNPASSVQGSASRVQRPTLASRAQEFRYAFLKFESYFKNFWECNNVKSQKHMETINEGFIVFHGFAPFIYLSCLCKESYLCRKSTIEETRLQGNCKICIYLSVSTLIPKLTNRSSCSQVFKIAAASKNIAQFTEKPQRWNSLFFKLQACSM